jgi:hypothetical protein
VVLPHPTRELMIRVQAAPPAAFLADFPHRYRLMPYDGSGVLVDLATGSLYELNRVATRICAALARGETPESIADDLARSFGVPPRVAARDIRAVLKQLTGDVAGLPHHPLTFRGDATGYRMEYRGAPMLHLDRDGHTLTRTAEAGPLPHPPAQILLWAAPHLLALLHRPVLHASAVERDDGVVAFCGASGAGKTTLARCLAEQGHPFISGDLLVLAREPDGLSVFPAGEAAIHAWAAEQAPLLDRPGTIDASGLTEAARGVTRPLREVWLADAGRRCGEAIVTRPVPPAEALILLLRNGFGEIPAREIWQEMLEIMQAIVATTAVKEVTVPDGVAALRRAAPVYSTSSAS